MNYLSGVKGDIDQGDILYPIKIKDYISWWNSDESYPVVIITPTCDIKQKKADHFRFLVLEPLQLFSLNIFQEIFGTDSISSNLSNTKKQKFENKLRDALRNSWPRYHFFESDGKIFKNDRIIDFELSVSVPLNEFNSNIRVARLNSPFKEELIHRFSHHVMRIGTPDLKSRHIDSLLKNQLNNFFK